MTGLNASEFLNRLAYPQAGDNARRKVTQYEDEITITAGQNRYKFFDTALGNIFARNKRLPISGNEIFYIREISLNLQTIINTAALFTSVQQLLVSGAIQIVVNGREQIKLPLIKVLNFPYANSIGNDSEQVDSRLFKSSYAFFFPILINSSSDVQVNLLINSTAATDFDTITLRCTLHGVQFDKLDAFTVDFLGSNEFQNIDYVFYDTNSITTANESSYELFVQTSGKAETDQSKYFPLSDIERAQLNKVEIYFYGDDAVTDLYNLIYNSRGRNVLDVSVNDVQLFNGNIFPFLSVGAVFGSTFSDVTPTLTNFVNMAFNRNQKILDVPIIIPAKATQSITLTQPGSSLSVENKFIVLFDGFIKRRVT